MSNDITSATSESNSDTPYDPSDPVAIASFWEGARIARRGKTVGFSRSLDHREAAEAIRISILVTRDVLDYFRATGPGWKAKINEALVDWVAAQNNQR